MSKYEWERGTIIVPAGQWSGFRRGVIAAWNQHQENHLSRARTLREKVLVLGKGKRGFDFIAAALADLRRDEGTVEIDEILKFLFADPHAPAGTKPRAPRRKDLKVLPVATGTVLHLPDASIMLDDASHALTWNVPENNHACDTAREHPVAKELFRLLDKIEWTRGSGGKIVGNDEYNRNSTEDGGGSNYVTTTYGH